MIVSRIVVKSERSVMTSATGDAKSGVELEAVLTPEEGTNPQAIAAIIQALQTNADTFVDQNLKSKTSHQ